MMYFLSVLEATFVFTRDIMHAGFFHDCRGIRTRTDAATSPSFAKNAASTPQKGTSTDIIHALFL